MSIGDELAAARRQAGLTVTQVSQRTCIRETIVRGIERGDYSACGGDFYARGHIRNIARAVGLDPEDLIREYDATQAPPQAITAADVFQPFTPVKLKERRRPNWSVVLARRADRGARHRRVPLLRLASSTTTRRRADNVERVQSQGQEVAGDDHAGLAPGADARACQGRRPSGRRDMGEADTSAAKSRSSRGTSAHSAGILASRGPGGDPITLQFGNPGGATLYLNGKKQPFSETTTPITVMCDLTACTTTLVG